MKRRFARLAQFIAVGLAFSVLPLPAEHLRIRHKQPVRMKATAYAQKGITASGDRTKRGVIAADPHVLPLGTKVRVTGAGPYSGQYTVKDTGRKIKGRKVDVFMPSRREAKRFGRKEVMITVVRPAPDNQDQR